MANALFPIGIIFTVVGVLFLILWGAVKNAPNYLVWISIPLLLLGLGLCLYAYYKNEN